MKFGNKFCTNTLNINEFEWLFSVWKVQCLKSKKEKSEK